MVLLLKSLFKMKESSTILIVEDEFIIANQLKTFLESEGFIVVGLVDNYEEAIEIIKTKTPDLVIADIRLYDDAEAGIRISQYVHNNYNIPVIFLSGFSDKMTIQRAKETNPNTFLIKPKPLNKTQLLATVEIALPSQGSISKNKAISFKGKEIEILEDYDHLKNEEKIENLTKIIDTNLISYIETYNHHFKNTLLIRFNDSKKGFLIRDEIEEIQKKLPGNFIRVHKSYIVNMKNIVGHKLPHYILIENISIPIGETHRQTVEVYFASAH